MRPRVPVSTGALVLAIMAKAPRAGRVKTRLSPPLSPAAAAALAHGLLVDTVRRVGQVDGVRKAMIYAPRTARQTPGSTAAAGKARPFFCSGGRWNGAAGGRSGSGELGEDVADVSAKRHV